MKSSLQSNFNLSLSENSAYHLDYISSKPFPTILFIDDNEFFMKVHPALSCQEPIELILSITPAVRGVSISSSPDRVYMKVKDCAAHFGVHFPDISSIDSSQQFILQIEARSPDVTIIPYISSPFRILPR